MIPRGPFDLEVEVTRFGGWPRLGDAVVMAFPVESWGSSAAVLVRQRGDTVTGEVHGAGALDVERAWQQALATVSLDVDGEGFLDVGRRVVLLNVWLRSQPPELMGRRQMRSRPK